MNGPVGDRLAIQHGLNRINQRGITFPLNLEPTPKTKHHLRRVRHSRRWLRTTEQHGGAILTH